MTKTPTQAFTLPREDLITTALAGWLMIGLLIDGWAHRSNAGIETFFTPWHAAFYSGFVAVAAWIVFLSRRQRPGINPGVPVGYGLGIAGIVVFGIGGVADMIWHTVFGIEVSLDALLSPTHLILLTGLLLILTSPVRSCWQRQTGRQAGWQLAGPAVIAIGLVMLLAQFFYMYASGFSTDTISIRYNLDNEFPIAFGVLEFTVTNLLLFGSALVLLKRWNPPVGTFTFMAALLGVGMQALDGFPRPLDILPAVVGGAFVDGLARRFNPGPDRPRLLRLWAVSAPIALWATVFAYRAVQGDLAWPITLWLGVIVLMGLWGLGLSVLAVSPAVPGERHFEA